MTVQVAFDRGIPVAAMTPLEYEIMRRTFDFELSGDGEAAVAWFYAEEEGGEADEVDFTYGELEELLDESLHVLSAANAYALSALQRIYLAHRRLGMAVPRGLSVTLNVSDPSWEFILQDVIYRTPGIDHVAYTRCAHGKTNFSELGAAVALITADGVSYRHSADTLEELLLEAGRAGLVPPARRPC